MEEHQGRGIADRIISAFQHLLTLSSTEIEKIGPVYAIPTFDPELYIELAKRAKSHFDSQNALITVPTPCYIVGDIHGNIFDLIRIFIYALCPPASRFLFLGDYVDRGEYSLEVVALLFALSIRYPDHVFLLRGNHEFERVNTIYGFKSEVEEQLGDMTVYKALNESFNYLSIVGRVGKGIFAVHGGISPQITSFRQITSIKKPITVYENHVCADLLWSDPTTDTKDYLRSQRGNGMTFGTNAVRDFAKSFGVNHIIRAHQCVIHGVEKFANGVLYTVFSCSNYAESSGNSCGLLFINDLEQIECFSLPPIEQHRRSAVKFKLIKGASNQLNGNLSMLGVDNSFSKKNFLSFFESPILPTYMRRLGSVENLTAISKQKRPATAEPVRPPPILT